MGEENNLRVLKVVVKTMGVLLILGTVALCIAVAVKFQSSSETSENGCGYKSGGVSVKSEVIEATTEGNVMTLLTAQEKGVQEVLLVDLCEGAVVSRFVVNDVRFAQ